MYPLAALTRGGTAGVALLLRTTTWTALPPRRAAQVEAASADAAARLEGGGWSAVQVASRMSVPAAWQQLVTRRSAQTRTAGPR